MREAVIQDFPRYSITDLGVVISYVRKTPKVMKPRRSRPRGLLMLELNEEPEPGAGVSVRRTQFVHKLVAQAFVKNPRRHTVVEHIDGNVQNNHYRNLRWVSKAESCQKTVIRGNHRMATLTVAEVREIKAEMRARNVTKAGKKAFRREMTQKYGVSSAVLYGVMTGFSWSYV